MEWADQIGAWIAGAGIDAELIFVAAYIVATLLVLPAGMFTIAAGALFGFIWGFALVTTSALAGAVLAFLFARHVLHEPVKKLIARKPALGSLDKALRKEGWRVVALLRLTPFIPFGLKNYLFGVTKVKLRDYVLGTAIGKIPGELVLLGLGATGRAAMSQEGASRWLLLGAGIVATLVASHLIARTAGKRLSFD